MDKARTILKSQDMQIITIFFNGYENVKPKSNGKKIRKNGKRKE